MKRMKAVKCKMGLRTSGGVFLCIGFCTQTSYSSVRAFLLCAGESSSHTSSPDNNIGPSSECNRYIILGHVPRCTVLIHFLTLYFLNVVLVDKTPCFLSPSVLRDLVHARNCLCIKFACDSSFFSGKLKIALCLGTRVPRTLSSSA